jgi:1-deoxy-D-xylulose-5-phosphate synthase
MDSKAKILDIINKPEDLKVVRRELLPQLAEEIRSEIINTVSKTGGHLASSLGAVDLIVALQYVFDMPRDKMIFDVGHQAYAHKLLTGRRDSFHALRQHGGIAGFPSRDESEYDSFGVGHSSTAISAALGFVVKRELKGEDFRVIAVIGDGSMTGGLTFEGLNNAGHLGKDMLVVLNDNEMFISHRVGAIAGYLARILTLGLVKKAERNIEMFLKRMHFLGLVLLRIAKRFKLLFFPGMLFEEMGFSYLGPVNGHDLFGMIDILEKIKTFKGPVILHVMTKKGKGYENAEKDPTKFHGPPKFEIESGSIEKDKTPTYTQVFSRTLIDLARNDSDIVALTAAMSEGTGLEAFAKEFPDRFFDVGIAEQHALTFSAGLAAAGLKPVCAIYSTFLQRGYDQLIHDIALQRLPVVVAIDRAGLVGEDGATHQGIFDMSFLRLVPNFIIMSPKDENELAHMLYTALKLKAPVAIRYPRGKVLGLEPVRGYSQLALGKSETLREGTDLYILAIGNMVHPALEAAGLLGEGGISCGVVNLRFAKPLDIENIRNVSLKTGKIVTVEENVLCGGVGSAVGEVLAGKADLLSIGLPDQFIEHGSQEALRKKYGLTPQGIAGKIEKWINQTTKIRV